jgi:hypothetical protein
LVGDLEAIKKKDRYNATIYNQVKCFSDKYCTVLLKYWNLTSPTKAVSEDTTTEQEHIINVRNKQVLLYFLQIEPVYIQHQQIKTIERDIGEVARLFGKMH